MASGARACVDLSNAAAADIVSTHTRGRGFDVIFDTVGGAALDAAFQMIKLAGDIVTVVGAASHNLSPLYLKGANLHMVLALLPIMYGVGIERHAEIMEIITAMAEQGRLTPRQDSEPFGLADAAAAHAKYEAGQAKGKIVIDISS